MKDIKRWLKKIVQIHFWFPLKRNPLFFVFGYSFFLIGISFMAAFTENAFLPVPEKTELNITEGAIEAIVRKSRGAYLIVREKGTGKEIAFPHKQASLPYGKTSISRLERKVGKPVKIFWKYRLFNDFFLFKNKSIWQMEVDGGVFKSYKTLAYNIRTGKPTSKMVFFGFMIINLFLIFFTWFRYRNAADTLSTK